MKDVLRLEFRKLKRQKSFYICGGIMLGLILLSAISGKFQNDTMKEIAGDEIILDGLMSFVTVISSVVGALSAGSFELLAAIFVSLAVCDDYSQQTIKNIYSRGYTRSQVYFGKAIYILITTSILYLAALLFAFLTGLIFFDMGSADGMKLLGLLGAQYLACMATVALYFFISILLRRTGASVAINIVGNMVIALLLTIVDLIISLNYMSDNIFADPEDVFSLSKYWLGSFVSYLSNMSVGTETVLTCVIASALYISLFVFFGWRFHRRTEVK